MNSDHKNLRRSLLAPVTSSVRSVALAGGRLVSCAALLSLAVLGTSCDEQKKVAQELSTLRAEGSEVQNHSAEIASRLEKVTAELTAVRESLAARHAGTAPQDQVKVLRRSIDELTAKKAALEKDVESLRKELTAYETTTH